VPRITAAELEAARSRTLPDVLPGPDDPPLRVLFSGINPGLLSAATGHHFRTSGQQVLAGIALVRVHTRACCAPMSRANWRRPGSASRTCALGPPRGADELFARGDGRRRAAATGPGGARTSGMARGRRDQPRTGPGSPRRRPSSGRSSRRWGTPASGRCPTPAAQRPLAAPRDGRRVRPAQRGLRVKPERGGHSSGGVS